jgi:phosphate-selective porin
MAHGRIRGRRLSYWTGVFVHDGDNASSRTVDGGGRTFATRVTSIPFGSLQPTASWRLQIGTAAAFTNVAADSIQPGGLRGRTVITEATFFSPVYVEGQRRRWEADVEWLSGPASVRAEYTHVIDERQRQGLQDDDLPDARYRSWYITGTYVLTGENAQHPVRPRREFGRGGFGALEAAVRFERIRFDSASSAGQPLSNPRAATILPNGEGVLTLGVNWSLHRFLMLQFNAIRERGVDPARTPAGRDAPFWSHVLRMQFAL